MTDLHQHPPRRLIRATPHPAAGEFVAELNRHASAFLFGRRTFDRFRGYWPDQTDPADPIATAVNSLPKCVVSNSLSPADAAWRRLFDVGILPATMRPVDVTVTDRGIVLGTYEPAGPVRRGEMQLDGWATAGSAVASRQPQPWPRLVRFRR